MAVQKQDGALTDARPSGADLRGKEMYLVKDDGNGNVVLCGDQEIVAGVISEGRDEDQWTSFNTGGLLKCVASAAISAGAKVCAAADGKVKAGTTNALGVARNDVANDLEIVSVWVDRS